ncbi:MAG: hypothetical protein PHE88_12375 [Elusimicrobia bacterium]|nr:hypothetical protein [Elusimicrobiota bacterium]
MFKKIEVNKLPDMFPYLIYQRVPLFPGARGKFYFPIDAGYWYWLHHLRCKYPEVDAAGVVFNVGMNIEMRGSARHREYENAPVSLKLLTSPCGNGVQLFAPAGMTATGPTSHFAINEMLPRRDNIEIYFSGHNATPFPAFIDCVLVGYMIPDKRMEQFKGTN